MATEARTAQLSVRLHERDKQRFAAAAEQCGMDPSVVARQLVEMLVQRLDFGGDLLDALQEAKRVWGKFPSTNVTTANSTELQPREPLEALQRRIDQLEREIRQRDARRLRKV